MTKKRAKQVLADCSHIVVMILLSKGMWVHILCLYLTYLQDKKHKISTIMNSLFVLFYCSGIIGRCWTLVSCVCSSAVWGAILSQSSALHMEISHICYKIQCPYSGLLNQYLPIPACVFYSLYMGEEWSRVCVCTFATCYLETCCFSLSK